MWKFIYRPYIKYTSSYNKDNKFLRIHMAFTDGHPRNELTNSIYYAYLENNHLYRGDSKFLLFSKFSHQKHYILEK
jgi:hypothetical protein